MPRTRSLAWSELKIGVLTVAAIVITAIMIFLLAGGTPIPEWGYVPSGRAPAQIADITEQASQGIEELTKMVHDVREGRGTVGKLMRDDQLYLELQRFVATAGKVTRGIQEGKGSI